MLVMVSARIDREMQRAIKKYRINVSHVIRNALKVEIRKQERLELMKKVSEARKLMNKTRMSDGKR